MKTNKESRPTVSDLTDGIYFNTVGLVRRTDEYGNVVLTLGDRQLTIGDDYEDDDETVWGWIWTTYERDTAADVWEPMTTDADPVDQEARVRQALTDWARA